jgi:hypothetical protein
METATARLAQEEVPIGPVEEPDRLAALDLDGLGDLSRAIEAAEEAKAEERTLASELSTLPEDASIEGLDDDDFLEALDAVALGLEHLGHAPLSEALEQAVSSESRVHETRPKAAST